MSESAQQKAELVPYVHVEGGSLQRFNPMETQARVAVLDAATKFYRNKRMIPQLEAAINDLIMEQTKFVYWWGENVGAGHGAGRGNKKNAGLSSFSREEAEKSTGITQQQVSRWRKRLKNVDAYRTKLLRAIELISAANHRAQGTGENEWYTPPEYVGAARGVLGEIDLDPATSEMAQHNIQAKNTFTQKDDGLKQEWNGNVWLNPPYAQPYIQEFVEKLVTEINNGNVKSAIMLTHNYTDTAWFHLAASIADAICFTRGRVKFTDQDGEACAPTQGQAFFYYGTNVRRFVEEFSKYGFILVHPEI